MLGKEPGGSGGEGDKEELCKAHHGVVGVGSRCKFSSIVEELCVSRPSLFATT